MANKNGKHEKEDEKKRDDDGQLPPTWPTPDPKEPKPGKHGR